VIPGKARLRLSSHAWRSLAQQIDPARSLLTWQIRLAYYLGGITNSLLQKIQQECYDDLLRAVVPHAPVFVLGFWRSGTTLLHELFCCDPQFGFPSTYACLNPCHFLLSERWIGKHQRQTPRLMDDLRYSWSSPQEDEFALLALGGRSPYQALVVPSLMRDVSSLLDANVAAPEDKDDWGATLTYFVKLLTIQQEKPLVLKSPAHGFRVLALRSLFPDAQYVIIDRNPYAVFASNLQLWKVLLDAYSLEKVEPEEIEEFVLAAYVLHEKAIAEGIRNMDDSRRFAFVRYEDLVAQPVEQMARIYSELGLQNMDNAQARLAEYLARTTGHKRNHYEMSSRQRSRVEVEWGRFIQGKGYGWPSQHLQLRCPP
jgi:omega-hydroxy-beta-dihydromenaquinone-9 sulfotransferase